MSTRTTSSQADGGGFPECLLVLRHWRDTELFTIGIPLRTVIMRKTDALLTDWGGCSRGGA